MARLVKNSPLKGLRGKLGGDLIFRVVGGETIISHVPGSCKKSSPMQARNRGRFREATEYAKGQMRIPERRDYYRKMAKKLKLPNGYTAAITEYMRGPLIADATLEKEQGGGVKVRVKICKKGFKVQETTKVRVNVTGPGRQEEAKIAVRDEKKGDWCASFDEFNSLSSITVEAYDAWDNYRRMVIYKDGRGYWVVRALY